MIKSSKRQCTDCYLPWPLTQILIISSIISKRSYNSISKCFYDPRKTAYETKNVERGEWILSSLCLPTVHSPLATTASVISFGGRQRVSTRRSPLQSLLCPVSLSHNSTFPLSLCFIYSGFRQVSAGSGYQTGVWGCPQLPWSDGEVVEGQIWAGDVVLEVDLGFDLSGSGSDLSRRVAGMDKCRCFRLSGQFTASSVFLCLLLRLLKVRTSLSCDSFWHEKGDGETLRWGLLYGTLSRQLPWRLVRIQIYRGMSG